MTPSDRSDRPTRRLAWAAALLAALALALLVIWAGHRAASGPEHGPPPAGGGEDAAASWLEVAVAGPDGKPIPGAHVVLARMGAGPVETTDPQGVARFEPLPRGPWGVTVEAPGWARAHRTLRVGPEGVRLPIQLERAGILTGRVLSERGEPVVGAAVRLDLPGCGVDAPPASCPPPWVRRTEEGGRFTFDTLGAGEYEARLSAERYAPEVRQVEVTLGTPTELEVALHLSATLEGTVRRAGGGPARGVTVVLAGSGVWPARGQPTDDEGRFVWEGIPSGVYELRARDGRQVAPPREGIIIEPGEHKQVTLVLSEGEVLRGRVVDDGTGAPIADAELLLTEEDLGLSPRALRTSEDGTFAFLGLLPRTHHLSVRAEGYVSQYATPREPGPDPIEVRMIPGATLRGVVYDARDRPVAGAHLEILGDSVLAAAAGGDFSEALFDAQLGGPSRLAPSGELGVTLGTVPPLPAATVGDAGAQAPGAFGRGGDLVTDAQGRFEITGLPAGTIQVLAQHPDHAPAPSTPVRLEPGQTVDDLAIVLPDGGTIDGRLVDPRGFPIGQVLVELAAEREPLPRTVLAADDGTFEFGGAIGVVTLTAYPGGHPTARERLEVAEGQTVQARLIIETELHELRGRVVDRRGFPIPGAEIRLRSLRARSPTRRATVSADDGTFSLAGLPPPPYRLEVDHPDFPPQSVARVGSTEEELRVTLMPGGAIRGAVRDGFRDVPAVGARVVLERGGEAVASTSTNNDGTFEFQRIRIGKYDIIASMPGLLTTGTEATLSEPPSGPIALDVGVLELSAGGSIRGQVVDALGDPVPDAEVAIGSPADWSDAARTDGEGSFERAGLPPGDIALWARHTEAGSLEEPTIVRIRPLEATDAIRLHLPERLPLERTEEPAAAYQTGVAVRVQRRGEGVEIAAVVSGSRAQDAGLRVGDRITSIDGTPVLVASQARSLLRGPAGIEAVVELERDGQTRRLHVARERFRPPPLP